MDGRWLVVVYGKESRQYDAIASPPIFSLDSKRMAYVAQMANVWVTIVDGEAKPYNAVGPLIFSPDGERVAYAATKSGDRLFVVVDGESGKEYDDVGGLVFSPNGKRIAYAATESSGKWRVMVDGKPGKYNIMGGSGIVFDSPDSLHYLAEKDMGIYLVERKIK